MDSSEIVKIDAIERSLMEGGIRRGFDRHVLTGACNLAKLAHCGQVRKSDNSPYVGHPLTAAQYALKMGCGQDAVVAAALHDVKEDAPLLAYRISRDFGSRVDELVSAVTKDSRIEDKRVRAAEARARVGWSVFVCGDSDVGLIKLADRVHNLRTSWHLGEQQVAQLKNESELFYRALADYIGLHQLGLWLATPHWWNKLPCFERQAKRTAA